MLTVLRDPVYGRLFTAQVLSLLGTGLTTVALALLAHDLAGADAGVVLGTALTLKMVAYVGVAPLASVLIVRLPRQKLLVGLDLYRAALVALLPFVDQVWQIYVLVFLFQAGSAAFTPTFQGTIPDVLPDEARYTQALSLSRLAYDLESLLSPLVAGLLLLVLEFHWLFVGTGLGFVASAALILVVTLPTIPSTDLPQPFIRRLGKGLRIYLATPRLRGLWAASFAVACVGAAVIVNSVVYAHQVLGGGDATYTLLLMAYGGGSMAVALALPPLLHRVALRTAVLGGIGVLAVAGGAVAVSPRWPEALGLWCLMGAGNALVLTPAGLLLRRSAHPDDRVALFAAQFALSHACWLLTYPAAGWLGASVGLGPTFALLALGAAVGGLLTARLWPGFDPWVLEHQHLAHHHHHPHIHDEHHQHAHEGWEGPEPHSHPHHHPPLRHRHPFVIDDHHGAWPRG
ncbi:MAG: MFS transporter [Candidatus Competibacterales bacterium]